MFQHSSLPVIPPEVWCFRYVFGILNTSSQGVSGTRQQLLDLFRGSCWLCVPTATVGAISRLATCQLPCQYVAHRGIDLCANTVEGSFV